MALHAVESRWKVRHPDEACSRSKSAVCTQNTSPVFVFRLWFLFVRGFCPEASPALNSSLASFIPLNAVFPFFPFNSYSGPEVRKHSGSVTGGDELQTDVQPFNGHRTETWTSADWKMMEKPRKGNKKLEPVVFFCCHSERNSHDSSRSASPLPPSVTFRNNERKQANVWDQQKQSCLVMYHVPSQHLMDPQVFWTRTDMSKMDMSRTENLAGKLTDVCPLHQGWSIRRSGSTSWSPRYYW